jgi:glycine betaine/proline transport system permease protein
MSPLEKAFEDHPLPVQRWFGEAATWLLDTLQPFVRAVSYPVDEVLTNVTDGLQAVPAELVLAGIFVLAWWSAGKRVALFSTASACLIGFMGYWDLALLTIAMVFTAVAFAVVVGVPLGILCSQSDRFYNVLVRPVLDIMQTTPSFVYLVPIVILFGIGTGPGVIATIVFGLPPIVRLTNLGIRQVRADLVEAGSAFGASRLQLLREVQLPLALPVIMAGVNQTVLLSVSMVVVASLIGAGGLGLPVLQGINTLDVGLSAAGGLAIVLLAISLDRMTEGLGARRFSAPVER